MGKIGLSKRLMSLFIVITMIMSFMSVISVQAAEVTPVEPSTIVEEDGKTYYAIDSYAKLVWFGQYVDSGNFTANAELTADIVAKMKMYL